ncbi:unnamed protein product [Caenorhabditis brenneri]
MGVPILKIPVVALKVLLDHLNDVELAKDSEIWDLCKATILELLLLESRRQGELPPWCFELFCSVNDDLELSISCLYFLVPIQFGALRDIENSVGVRSNLKIGELFVPVLTTKQNNGAEKIRIFWNSEPNGMILLLDYFKSNFDLSLEELKFGGKNTRAVKTVINHINSTQTRVRRVEAAQIFSDDAYKFVLENVSATKSFFSSFSPDPEFKFNGTIRAKNIRIYYCKWLTLESLLNNTKSKVIEVGTDFKEEECRTFLREWQSDLSEEEKINRQRLEAKVIPMAL